MSPLVSVGPCFLGEALSLVDGYMHSGTRLLDYASDSLVDFGQGINPSQPQFPHLIFNRESLILTRRCSL